MIGGIVVVVGATACSTADPSTAQIALHYSNGPFSSKVFQDCVAPGTLKYQGANDDHFYYPVGQRTVRFDSAEGADAPPLTITSHDGQVMAVNGILTFHLDTSCQPYTDRQGVTWRGGILQKFHEQVALQQKDVAYASADGEPGPGWDQLVAKFLIAPMERGVSNQALNFDSQALFSDAASKAQWEKQSVDEIPKIVLQQSGEPYFVIDSILLQKPTSQTLQDGLAAVKSSTLRAQSASIDQQTASSFPGGVPGYLAYLNQQAVNKAIADGKAQIVVNGGGSPLIVNGTK